MLQKLKINISFLFYNISAPRTNFTQGGVCVFSLDKYGDKEKITPLEKSICIDRQGFYGWFGLGGSVLQVRHANN